MSGRGGPCVAGVPSDTAWPPARCARYGTGMDERWVMGIDDDPREHRDLDSVRRLLAGALGADPELRVASINALSRVVKELENEDVPASRQAIGEALPRLVDGLLVEDEGNVDGCTISILRRVRPDWATVDRLLELLPGARHPELLLEAIKLHRWEAWPSEIEQIFADHLPIAPYAAGYALYCGARDLIRLESTLRALAEAAGEDRDYWGRHYAITALCVLLGRQELSELALSLLHELLGSASERSRKEMAAALGWASRGDAGDPLLLRLAADPSAEVRAAAEASQQRAGERTG